MNSIDIESRTPFAEMLEKRTGEFAAEHTAWLKETCIEWGMPDALTADNESMEWFVLNNDIGNRTMPGNVFYPDGWKGIKKEIESTKSYTELKQVYFKHKSLQDHWKFIHLIKEQRRVNGWE